MKNLSHTYISPVIYTLIITFIISLITLTIMALINVYELSIEFEFTFFFDYLEDLLIRDTISLPSRWFELGRMDGIYFVKEASSWHPSFEKGKYLTNEYLMDKARAVLLEAINKRDSNLVEKVITEQYNGFYSVINKYGRTNVRYITALHSLLNDPCYISLKNSINAINANNR